MNYGIGIFAAVKCRNFEKRRTTHSEICDGGEEEEDLFVFNDTVIGTAVINTHFVGTVPAVKPGRITQA